MFCPILVFHVLDMLSSRLISDIYTLFLTRGYARAYHELLQGLRYANESLTHSLVVDALRN